MEAACCLTICFARILFCFSKRAHLSLFGRSLADFQFEPQMSKETILLGLASFFVLVIVRMHFALQPATQHFQERTAVRKPSFRMTTKVF